MLINFKNIYINLFKCVYVYVLLSEVLSIESDMFFINLIIYNIYNKKTKKYASFQL